MIAKISRSKDVPALIRYVLRNKALPENLGGSIAFSLSAREIINEFQLIYTFRKEIRKPVYHMSLSLPKEEWLSSSTWLFLVRDFLEYQGIDPCMHAWMTVRHRNTTHDHVHIVVSRVNSLGQVFVGKGDLFRVIRAKSMMEIKYNLQRIPFKYHRKSRLHLAA